MRRTLFALPIAIMASPASAALPVGASAPEIVSTGALAGRPYKLDLNRELRKGPVVLYFFPKAGTQGCNAEAAMFSKNIRKFRKAGAHVIGMSADGYDALKPFSMKECSRAFPVATATPATQKAYDVVNATYPGLTTRTSYVIARSGKIVMVHDDPDHSQHVPLTLAAVQALKK
jgi:peroxiredoxin Q/BCP